MFQNTCVDLLMAPCIMSMLEGTQNSSKADQAAEERRYIFGTTSFSLRVSSEQPCRAYPAGRF
jgi:hypothetical protein